MFRLTVGYQPEHEPRYWTGVLYLTREEAKTAAMRWLTEHDSDAMARAYVEVEPVHAAVRAHDGLGGHVRQLPIYGRPAARPLVTVRGGLTL